MKLKYIFLASALVLTSCTTPIKFTIKTHTSDTPSVTTTTEEPTTTTTSVEPTSTDEPNTSTSTKEPTTTTSDEPTTTTSREDVVYSDDDDWGPLHD